MSERKLELRCPKCESTLNVDAAQAGEQVDCPRCQNSLLVPGEKKKPGDVTVDDLIDFDDDILHPRQTSSEAVQAAAESPDGAPAKRPDDIPPAEVAEPTAEDDDDAGLDDLLPLTAEKSPIPSSDEAKDPFEVDANAALRVEGITPPENTFSTPCPLCGSLVYATPSQVGQKLKCYDCHTLVEIAKPKQKPPPTSYTVAPSPATPQTGDAEGYRLGPAVEPPAVDTRIDTSEGKIDFNDEEFFKRKRQLEALPDSVDDQSSFDELNEIGDAEAPEPEIDYLDDDDDEGSGAGYELAPASAAAKPTSAPWETTEPPVSNVEREQDESVPHLKRQTEMSEPASDRSTTEETAADQPVRVEPISESGDGDRGNDIASPVAGLGKLVPDAFLKFKSLELLVRLGFTALALTIVYGIMLLGSSLVTNEEGNKFYILFGVLIFGFALVGLAGILFAVGAMANTVIRDAMEQRESMVEMKEFALADWASDCLFVATSFAAAALPGLIFGQLLLLSTGSFMAMVIPALITGFVLAPIFLAAVVYNEAPWSLYSPGVFQSMGALRNRWIRFSIIGVAVAIVFGTSVLLVQLGFITAMLMAVIQIAILFAYFWLLGGHVGHVVRQMVKHAESSN